MLKEVKVFVEAFNSLETNVGQVDYRFFDLESEECLYYFYPLLERLCREHLAENNRWTIEVYENNRYKTLNSILRSNMIYTEELNERIREIYEEGGPRNKYMHGFNFRSQEIIQSLITDVKQIVLLMIMFKVLENGKNEKSIKK